MLVGYGRAFSAAVFALGVVVALALWPLHNPKIPSSDSSLWVATLRALGGRAWRCCVAYLRRWAFHLFETRAVQSIWSGMFNARPVGRRCVPKPLTSTETRS